MRGLCSSKVDEGDLSLFGFGVLGFLIICDFNLSLKKMKTRLRKKRKIGFTYTIILKSVIYSSL
jgi:hypothetical protein